MNGRLFSGHCGALHADQSASGKCEGQSELTIGMRVWIGHEKMQKLFRQYGLADCDLFPAAPQIVGLSSNVESDNSLREIFMKMSALLKRWAEVVSPA